MDERIFIPYGFLIVVDDVGWWCGYDQRYKNGPTRSGIERYHCIEDYKAIIEIGKSLNMRIKCGFVAGEWDRNNILAKVPNSNKHGSDWDNASRLHPQIEEGTLSMPTVRTSSLPCTALCICTGTMTEKCSLPNFINETKKRAKTA